LSINGRYQGKDTRYKYKTRLVSLLRYLLLGTLAALVQASTATANDSADYQTKAAKLEQLRNQIEALRTELNQAQGQQGELHNQLRNTEQAIGKLTQSLRERTAQLHIQTQKLAELQASRQTQQAALVAQRRALAEQLRAAYMTGRQEYLKLLLNQQDPVLLGRSMVYYDYFNRARTRQISQLNAGLTQLVGLEQTINRQTAELVQLRAAEQQEKQALEQNQQQRRQILVKLDNEILNQNQTLQSMLGDARQLELLLPKLQRALANIGAEAGNRVPFAQLKGKLPWPLRGPILSPYGSARMAGAMRWQGVLIGAQEGQEVRAISAGRVAFADWLRGFGLLVIIDHGDGYMSLYGHNQSLFKHTGDWVEGGEPIAGAGNTGGNNTAGLYFEIRHQGEPNNPGIWCKQEG